MWIAPLPAHPVTSQMESKVRGDETIVAIAFTKALVCFMRVEIGLAAAIRFSPCLGRALGK